MCQVESDPGPQFLDALASLKTMLDIVSLMFSRFQDYRVLESITEYCRVLQSITECHIELKSVTEYKSVKECKRVLQSITEC